jgi:hypothetical protein
MTPLKRVLVAIAALLILMIGALYLSWRSQARALGDALVTDVAATMTRRIERTPELHSAKHENGYACLADALATMPSDLRPIDFRDENGLNQLLEGGALPEALRPQFDVIASWAETVRACGDSEHLAYVPGVTPFEALTTGTRDPSAALSVLTRVTRMQAIVLVADQRWEQLADVCAGTFEFALDYGHVDLTGAMVAINALMHLGKPCAEALQRLQPGSRARFAQRFARLPSRQASNSELVELEWQRHKLGWFQPVLTPAQRLRLPAANDLVGRFFDYPTIRVTLPRLLSQYDRAMRQLTVTANQPALRRTSQAEVNAVISQWWAPSGLFAVLPPNYERFFERNDEAAVLLKALSELAAGDEVTLNPLLAKTTDGLVLTRTGSEALIIPLVH